MTTAQHPARPRITEPDDVYLALTSYPPGDAATERQLVEVREAVARAFEQWNGVLEVEKQSGLLLSIKTN